MAPSKNVQFSEEQKERLLSYMQGHLEFANGRFLGALGRQKSKEMWEKLAGHLNSVGMGATKNVARWKSVSTSQLYTENHIPFIRYIIFHE